MKKLIILLNLLYATHTHSVDYSTLAKTLLIVVPISMYSTIVGAKLIDKCDKKFPHITAMGIGMGTILPLGLISMIFPLIYRNHPVASLFPAFAASSIFSNLLYDMKELYHIRDKSYQLSYCLIPGFIYSALYCELIEHHNAAVTIGILGILISLGIKKPGKITNNKTYIKKQKNYYGMIPPVTNPYSGGNSEE